METLDKGTITSYLSFKLGEEIFAANVNSVINILEMVRITEVPQAPEFMKGVINLRGEVLPVIDTRVKFGMPKTELTKNTCIIVMELMMESEMVKIGALVDSVLEVLQSADDELQPAPSLGNGYKSEFLIGMIKNDDRFIMVLDTDKVFSSSEIVELKEVLDQAHSEENKKEKKTKK